MGSKRWLAGVGRLLLVAAMGLALVSCDLDSSRDDSGDSRGKKKKNKKKKKGSKEIKGNKKKGAISAKGLPEADNYLVDNGFRPHLHGLPWQNGDRDNNGKPISYPRTSKGHLNSDGVQRLFGSERVCAGGKGDSCKLTPAADQFLQKVNRSMNGGMCEGMAVLGLSIWTGKDKPSYFSKGAESGHDLKRDISRGPVGYYFSFQYLQPFRNYIYGTMDRSTPAKVLDDVIAGIKDKGDPVALEFLQPGVGGHAVVPYAVEDKGNGVFWIRVWDNNFPDQSKAIQIDKNANTWTYAHAAINPSEKAGAWGGNAARNTIVATRLSKRMFDAVCPFCKDSKSNSRMIMVAGGGRALITDSSGNRLGKVGDAWVNEIPGAELRPQFAYVLDRPQAEPLYVVPANMELNVAITGGGGEKADFAVFGAGAALVVDDIGAGKGQTDELTLAADGFGISYAAKSADAAPKVRLALDRNGDDFLLDLKGLTAAKGKKMSFSVDPDKLKLQVKDDGQNTDDFDFSITKMMSDGTAKTFNKADLPKGRGLTGSDGVDFSSL